MNTDFTENFVRSPGKLNQKPALVLNADYRPLSYFPSRIRISSQPYLVLLRARTRLEREYSQSQVRLHRSSNDPRRILHHGTVVGATNNDYSRRQSHHIPRRIQECRVLPTLRIRASIDCGEFGHSGSAKHYPHAVGPKVRSNHRKQSGQTSGAHGGPSPCHQTCEQG